jgi:endonuclease/exonuclease/phosphatase family metal-dependent hydrolase
MKIKDAKQFTAGGHPLLLVTVAIAGLALSGCRSQTESTSVPAAAAPEQPAPASRADQPPVATEPFLDRASPDAIRVVSFNINSVWPDVHYLDTPRFDRVIKALAPDILCLQEVSSDLDEAALAERVAALLGNDPTEWYGYMGRSGRMGNAILSRFPLTQTGEVTVPPAYRGQENRGRNARLAFARIDLPDEAYRVDLFVTNVHFKCCGGTDNDPLRQQEIDAVMAWWRDAMQPGDEIDVPKQTGFIIAGDLNTVGGPVILETALTGDIGDNERYGADFLPDWDATGLVDAKPPHNLVGPAIYTWRNDTSQYDPGRLDYIIYSDSVLTAEKAFTLNTMTLSPALLELYGLEEYDVAEDEFGREVDHLPLVVDFKVAAAPTAVNE